MPRPVFSFVVKVQDGPELLIRPDDDTKFSESEMEKAAVIAVDDGINGRIQAWSYHDNGPERTNLQKGQYISVPADAIMFVAVREGRD